MAKQTYVIITFENVTEALKLEKECKKRGFAGKLVPTPRALSTSCALSWRAEPELEAAIRAITTEARIHVHDIRRMEL